MGSQSNRGPVGIQYGKCWAGGAQDLRECGRGLILKGLTHSLIQETLNTLKQGAVLKREMMCSRYDEGRSEERGGLRLVG